ncbi:MULTISPECIES: spore germination protein [unclassified Ruminococcus]|uniref:spore germination protein n=1 Tax=unclassified Ruminococcus TaxID=2608920 RepID=UPI00210D82DE|nr:MULTISPECIES: spore germination protein [unclassified Ruminococcus]MCQ4023382.1 spore germination protein [Ruminococcus sp. zg-924]MCQ4115749.1 spore germination protein [Ruminococcus sp. zg-921]
MALCSDIKSNEMIMEQTLQSDKSFDLISRALVINGRKARLYFVDGLIKDSVMEKVLEFLYSIKDESFMQNADTFLSCCMPYIEASAEEDESKAATAVFSGVSALLVDGFSKAILIDGRSYPQRETAEPEKDKVLRGSHDGFVETLISNTALIRRRIRSSQLRVTPFVVGKSSKTDIAMIFMDGRADTKLLHKLEKALNEIDCDSLTMNQESLVELLFGRKWYNPFPKIKYTERPDSAASAILEGNIVILVDNSPSALVLPTSIFDVMEEADDYYFSPITGTYLRLARYVVTFATLFITPMWLLALKYPEALPDALQFVLPKDPINVPIFWQLIILEIAIDGLRLASLNTPSTLSTALSIIGAIALSDFAVSSGWFCSEAILYMAFVAVANYSQPSYELSYALKFMRVILLITTQLFGILGFIGGLIIIIAIALTNKTVSGKSYLYPLIPFNGKALLHKVLRLRKTN